MENFENYIWNYKNFNMVNELGISGEFIYDGMQKLNEMSCIEQGASLFTCLYYLSVGIERLQKIILVLYEKITYDNFESFETDLKTHSHIELSRRISNHSSEKLNNQENDFMQVLTGFYNNARYNRFNVMSNDCEEEKLLTSHIEKHLEGSKIQYHFISGKIVVNEHVREYIGRVVGKLSKKYYKLLREQAIKNNTYSYELIPYSKAERVFLSNNRKNSLQELKITEVTAFKEFLIYLRNTKQSSSLLRYIEKIKPLDIDPALINDYIAGLASINIPADLIDEIETLYDENEYSIDRIRDVNAIGDTCVDFDIGDVFDCLQQIEDVISGHISIGDFSIKFPKFINRIDNDDITIEFDDVLVLCSQLSNTEISKDTFMCSLKTIQNEIKSYYNIA